MRSMVVFVAVLALTAAAPSGEPGLKKRSIGHAVAYTVPTSVLATEVVEPVVYSSPSVYAPAATLYSTGSAVSHQSRVDVRTSPALVATSPAVVAASPAVVAAAPAVVDARTVYSAPLYSAPAAVSHQSRYDVRSSPALLTEQVVSPAVYNQQFVAAPAVVDARSLWSPSVYATSW